MKSNRSGSIIFAQKADIKTAPRWAGWFEQGSLNIFSAAYRALINVLLRKIFLYKFWVKWVCA